MIDVFALAPIPAHEPVQTIYRSHPVRLGVRLGVATICLVLPFFFLFDLQGWMWGVAIICWFIGLALLWLAFDVWSSSIILVTSERIVGAERGSWGRVRLHDWHVDLAGRQPVWTASRFFPWLGTLVWSRADGATLSLSWTRPPVGHHATPSLGLRRRRLLRRLRKANLSTIEAVERCIDDTHAS